MLVECRGGNRRVGGPAPLVNRLTPILRTDPSPIRASRAERMLVVTTGDQHDMSDGHLELATAVHQVLAALTDIRPSTLSTAVLRDRIELTRWLRGELLAVETLLAGAYEGASAAAAGPPAAEGLPATR